MTIKEKVAYMKGLAEGMDITTTDDGKLFSIIIETLSDIADEIEELNENALDIGEELDAISADLADVEELLEDMELDEDDWDDEDDDYGDWDDDDDVIDCDNCGKGKYSIDVNCPECNAELELDEKDIANELITCPVCGKDIELEIDEIDVDDEE